MRDVLVIGGGQAGLAAGYFLRRTGVEFELLERHDRIGTSWRARYDSLVLFSPRAFSALPGLPLDGNPDGYPTKDEIADYLERYAITWGLPVTTAEGVIRLERDDDGFVAHTTTGRTLLAKAVIVAAGAFQRPVVPSFAQRLSPAVRQFTVETYRNPDRIPPGPVLVVGGGASGRQIAWELAAVRDVSLSVGRSVSIVPQRVLGRDTMWWSHRLGLLHAHKRSRLGQLARQLDAFPGWHLRSRALQRCGVRLHGRTFGADDARFRFADGTSGSFESVVWAIGYQDATSWLRVPGALDPGARVIEMEGASPVPGLFYVGRSWQTCRASALLCGVGADAERIVTAAVAMTREDVRGARTSRPADPSRSRSSRRPARPPVR